MHRYICLAVLLATTVFNSTAVLAKSVVYQDVKDLAVFERELKQYTANNQGKVLLVYDIDDTLMETVSFFGGDTWYNWQMGRAMQHENGSEVRISEEDVLTCPFSKMGVFFDLGEAHPVEKTTVSVVNQLQQEYDTLVLTSRSPDYRSGTQRILDGAGFNFVDASLLDKDQALYYQFDDGKSTRGVSYANGVVMSTGLNKGKVLRDILRRANKRYDAVFFIDDSHNNIVNMQKEWQEDQTELFIFHYTHVAKVISDADVQLSKQAKAAFNQFIKTAFPARFEQFSNKQCY